MEEVVQKPKTAAESDAIIARRLESILHITREDEAKFLRVLTMRRLKRRAEVAFPKKGY